MQEALAIVRSGTVGYGLSIDIDALDPTDAPAVGTPEPNGISAQALCEALSLVKEDSKLLGLEITEFNPHHNQAHKTEQWVAELITSVYAGN